MRVVHPAALAALIAACVAGAAPSLAADPIKIGFLSSFSGPQAPTGQDLYDGFMLGIEHAGGKLGGMPVEVIQGDDQAKADIGQQVAKKMLQNDKIQIMTGISVSNVLLPVVRLTTEAKVPLVNVNAGPSPLAGEQCDPLFFSTSWQNDTTSEALGEYLNKAGVKNVYLLAANYQAGKDVLAGFKRTYKGEIAGEVYTPLTQLEFSTEIAQLRSKAPAALFIFYPGGLGIQFIKQYNQARLQETIPLYGAAGLDQIVLPAVGDASIGIKVAMTWAETLDNPANKRFVAAFEAKHGRIPSAYAANAYDGAHILDAAIKAVRGDLKNRAAFVQALEQVKFDSVRGNFRFGTNHFPIQDHYMLEVVKDAKGRPVMAVRDTINRAAVDSYATQCRMPQLGK